MRRHALGIASLLLIAIGAGLYFANLHPGQGAIMIRAGGACGVIWLAYPQLTRIPKIFVVGIVAFVLTLAVRPKVAPIIMLVLIAIAILRPKKKKSVQRASASKANSQSSRLQ